MESNFLYKLKTFLKTKTGKFSTAVAALILFGWFFMAALYNPFFEWYTGVENAPLTYESSKELSYDEFKSVAADLTYEERHKKAMAVVADEENDFTRKLKAEMLMSTPSFMKETEFKHIKYFEEAGIRQYDGPSTCLTCHQTMTIQQKDGTVREVDLMKDLLAGVHFQFQSMATGFTTYGYDGRQVNEEGRAIPVGKIDRACGIPGSFSWTGWAALIESKPEHLHGEIEYRSEGCGQCHIGGNYHPATEHMMPVGDIPSYVQEGIDCLICHSQNYDMNYKYVIKDDVGARWNQDRTMKAALSVTNPTNENCLNCHQHNMGGDVYENNVSAKNLGYKNKRLLHEGAKRANPFSKEHDVHYSAGLLCTDCHRPEGHKIPRGTKGTDLVANDIPGKEVSCEMCHTAAPHTENELTRVILNGHTSRLACETCHITHLQEENVVLRDWVNARWNDEEGIYTPTDVLRSGEPDVGYTFLWFNGNGTFLANALGNNPNKSDSYNPLMDRITRIDDPEVLQMVRDNVTEKLGDDVDQEEYMKAIENALAQLTPEMLERRKQAIDKNIKPLQNMGESKIYPFKLFNAYMYEDLNNRGPFGAMILPFDYKTYYETGNTEEAVKVAIQNPIVKRMYQFAFKVYMMDEFMKYFGVDEWNAEFPLDDDGNLVNVEPRWMRQYGTLMVNHGITRDGYDCETCHTENGIMNFEKLGYSPERVKDLENLKELKYFKGNKVASN